MTITYQDSKRISGLSTDTKPTKALSLTGCKAYYNFEQTSGNLTNIATTASGFPDGLGSSVDATPYNGVVQNATGKVGSYSWDFDGTDDYASTSSGTTPLSGATKFTWSVWIYESNWASITAAGEAYPWVDGNFTSPYGSHTVATNIAGASFITYIAGAGNDGGNNNGNFNISGLSSGWHHFVVVYDGSGSTNADKLKLYIDNTQRTLTFAGTIPSSLKTVTAQSFIGKAGGYNFPFKGRMDDMSIWNRALSASEISILYNSGSGVAVNATSAPQTNSIAVDTDTGARRWFDGNNWTPSDPSRGISAGGYSTAGYANSAVIDYITIATTGNATNFGNLTVARASLGGVSSSTRGVFGGGNGSPNLNTIDYITIATTGNATSFGSLSAGRDVANGSVHSDTRGVFTGGYETGYVATMEYITMATTGNTTNFGSLTVTRGYTAGVNSTTRGCIGGGLNASSRQSVIDYITIATTGNATSFGNLSSTRYGFMAVNSNVRGVFGGGNEASTVNTIEYITIDTTGNATNFGQLTIPMTQGAGMNSLTRGVFAGADNGTAGNTMCYITIPTTGNATDFGDLLVTKWYNTGAEA